jgi:hypothetical protein
MSAFNLIIQKIKSGKFRNQLDERFSWWGEFSYQHAWPIILVASVIVGLFAYQAQNIHLDTSTESFLEKSHPARIAYKEFREEFGRDEKMVIALAPDELFSLPFLNTLKQLHEELEGAPHVREVNSLINARQTYGDGDQLIVGELLEEWPETDEDLAALRQKVLSNPLYRGALISEDGAKTTLAITTETYSSAALEQLDALAGFDENEVQTAASEELPFLSGEENSEFVEAVEAIIARYSGPDLEIHFAGTPPMTHRLMKLMSADIVKFTSLSILCIAFFLAILFRRLSSIVLPILVAMLSLVTTIGMMALLNIALTPIGQSMPSFLLAVGVSNSVHLLVIFFQGVQAGRDKKAALKYALGHSGLPIVMTSLTTAGGIASFTTVEIAHVVDFGIITTIGIVNALIFSLLLLPALIAVFPVKLAVKSDRKEGEGQSWSASILLWCGNFATNHAGKVVAFYALLIVVSLLSASTIRFSHDPVRWFKNDDPMLIGIEYVDKFFSGAMYLEVLVDTKQTNGIKDPEMLNRIEAMHQVVEEVQVGEVKATKSFSIVDISKEIHKALNENRPEFYAIPQDPDLLSQELLLFENSGADDLSDFTDSQFSTARFTMILPALDAINYNPYTELLKSRFDAIFDGTAEVSYAGIITLMTGAITALMDSLAKTYVLAFLIITPLMMLIIGSFRVGLISMIPNLTPIIIILGIMGWRDFPMDAFTLLTGSIALGLAVDDTIHFMHNFRRYYQQSGDTKIAVRKTLSTTGQALFITSAVLSCGFFIYMFSSMNNLINFGVLTGITIILALLADIILAPALMVVLEPLMKSTYKVHGGQGRHEDIVGQYTPATDRRASSRRTLTDSVTAVIKIKGTAYSACVIDVSSGLGLQVSDALVLSVGDEVEVESSLTGVVKGSVAWLSEQQLGLKLVA